MNRPNNKRSQNSVSLKLKNEILEASGSQRELSKQFDLPRTTIRDILKNKVAIQSAIADGQDGKRARLRMAKAEDVEKALVIWIGNVRSQNVPLFFSLLLMILLIIFLEIKKQ
jgi:hypothetical protein